MIEYSEILTCKLCGHSDDYDTFEIAGACDGNTFCPNCYGEIDSDTGEKAKLCGKCDWCEWLVIDSEKPKQIGLF